MNRYCSVCVLQLRDVQIVRISVTHGRLQGPLVNKSTSTPCMQRETTHHSILTASQRMPNTRIQSLGLRCTTWLLLTASVAVLRSTHNIGVVLLGWLSN